MNKIGITTLLVLGVTVGPTLVNAQTETLDYQGNPFSLTSQSCSGSGCTLLDGGLITTASAGQSITGELVINGPLPDNGTVDFESGGPNSPVSVNFKVAGISLGAFGGLDQAGSFLFTTTHGLITSWDFSAGAGAFIGDTGAGEIVFGESQTPVAGAPPQGPGDGYTGLINYGEPPGSFQTNGSGSIPGAWTINVQQAPEIDSRSAVSALTLLFGAIAVLRGRRSKPMINARN